ncbi:MAG: hypothetical protein LBP35_04945 [Candidatus Ancillula trichonymphae]|nr:hypothetical protein [Candidatus Ancillula trichonymphae]
MEDFATELANTAKKNHVAVADLSRSVQVVVSPAAFGALDGRDTVTRKGARVGDVVALCGELGMSTIGLER